MDCYTILYHRGLVIYTYLDIFRYHTTTDIVERDETILGKICD